MKIDRLSSSGFRFRARVEPQRWLLAVLLAGTGCELIAPLPPVDHDGGVLHDGDVVDVPTDRTVDALVDGTVDTLADGAVDGGVVDAPVDGVVDGGGADGPPDGADDGDVDDASSDAAVDAPSSSPGCSAQVSFVEIPIPTLKNVFSTAIAYRSDRTLWFTEYSGNHIGRVTTAGEIEELPFEVGGSNDIVVASDGSIWFTEFGNGKVGSVTGDGRFFEIAFPDNHPSCLTVGPDGNLWVTLVASNQSVRDQFVRISPAADLDAVTSSIAYVPGPSIGINLGVISSGPDAFLWFAEYGQERIGRLSPASPNTLTEFDLPSTGPAAGMARGSDGNLWIIERGGNKIARVTHSGTFMELSVPSAASGLKGMTASPDGNLWFTEGDANKIGCLTPEGAITEYPIPTADSHPSGIVTDADGNLWFTEGSGNKIARLTVTH